MMMSAALSEVSMTRNCRLAAVLGLFVVVGLALPSVVFAQRHAPPAGGAHVTGGGAHVAVPRTYPGPYYRPYYRPYYYRPYYYRPYYYPWYYSPWSVGFVVGFGFGWGASAAGYA